MYVYVQITGLLAESGSAGQVGVVDAAWVIEQLSSALLALSHESAGARALQLLDLVQAQHYQHLQLGILLGCDDQLSLPALSMALRTAVGNSGLQVSVESVSSAVVAGVLEMAKTHSYVLTVLASGLPSSLLQAVSALLSRHGLHITRSQRLTAMPKDLLSAPLADDEPAPDSGVADAPYVFDFHLHGPAEGIENLQQDLVSASENLGMDLVLQRDDAQRRFKRLAVFDMDSTLIKAEVIDELARRAGVGDQVAAITERAMRGEIDFCESFTARMALLKGLSVEHLSEIAQALPIMDGAKTLFATLKAFGIKTAIISGGFTYFAEHLQQHLGIDFIFANTLAIANGQVTGEVVKPIVDASRKAEIVKSLAAEQGIDLSQVVAVGDGANDLLMLDAVGAGIAFRAKPVVRQSSKLALTTVGLEGVLYLMGLDARDHQ